MRPAHGPAETGAGPALGYSRAPPPGPPHSPALPTPAVRHPVPGV
jgi:hypothetical protein